MPYIYSISDKPVNAYLDFIKYNDIGSRISIFKRYFHQSRSLTECQKVADSIKNDILNGDFQDTLFDELVTFINNNFKKEYIKLAVRSSSISEDSEHYSFAGQYDTFLNINPNAYDLIDKIKEVWASQWNHRIVSYLYKQKLNSIIPRMGVIIQEMLNPQISGVLFSRNPINFNKNEIVIEFIQGLGDKLVSGQETPVQLIFNRKSKNYIHLNAELAESYLEPLTYLIHIAQDIEKRFGFELDLEWAYCNSKIHLLQMRPITDSKNDIIIWTNENVGEVIPDNIKSNNK